MWQGMRRWSIRKQLASGTEQKTRNDPRPSVASRSRRWAEAAEAPGWAGTRAGTLGPAARSSSGLPSSARRGSAVSPGPARPLRGECAESDQLPLLPWLRMAGLTAAC